MKATDLSGNVLSGSQYTWGEVNNGRFWNASTATWTYSYVWGSISVQFVQSGNTLNMNVTIANSPSSGIIFDGATIYPLVLNFPQLPSGFTDPTYEHLAFNTTGPSVTVADFGQGEVISALTDASKPLYSGFQPTGLANSYFPIISGTSIDNMATFFPHFDRPVPPGQSDSFTVSLRFAPSGTDPSTLVADVYKNWAQTWPPQINWTDRRIIGTAYLASSPTGNVNQPGGYPNNPRRYFNDSNPNDFDVTNPAGLAKFQARILQQAQINVQNLQQLNAQGAITWDIEGEQYPQNTSYVCSPDQIAQVAPEMESVITGSSPYAGMKLDDAYFSIMRKAGFRVGVCIRPQQFNLYPDGTAGQTYVANSQLVTQLTGKMKYAHDRWGATLFYVDSDVDVNGGNLDPSIFQQVAAALPDSLIIPEESTPKYYAYTAPFESFIFHTDLGTPSNVYNYYPNAFSANLINDVDPGKLAQYRQTLTQSVSHGDVLMVHADYWQANDPTVVQIYKDAGVWNPSTPVPAPGPSPTPAPTPSPTPSPTPTPTPTPTPAPTPPPGGPVSITTPTSGQTISGSFIVKAQINDSLDAAGSYLLLDGVEVGTYRVTGAPYAYTLDTTKTSNGQHTLQIWAHDTANSTLISPAVSVTVSNGTTSTPAPSPAPPAPGPAPSQPTYPISLQFPANGQTVSNTIYATAIISSPLSSAGSYLMVDNQESGSSRLTNGPYNYYLDTTKLSNGQHTLQVWALDFGNRTLLSNPVVITVSN